MPKKRSKAKVIYIEEDVFLSKLTVVVGTNEEIINQLKKWMIPEDHDKVEELVDPDSTESAFFQIEKENTSCNVIFMKKNSISDSLIVHEMYHAVCSTIRNKGIKISEETEEVIAYLLGFYVGEFNKLYKKGKK